jgi:hypothetical protein
MLVVLPVQAELDGDMDNLEGSTVNSTFATLLRNLADLVEGLDADRFTVTGLTMNPFDPYADPVMQLEAVLYDANNSASLQS